jgi:ankyrin repeat protein
MKAWRPGWKAVWIAAALTGLAGGSLPAAALTGPHVISAVVSLRDPFGRFQQNLRTLIQKGRRALRQGRLDKAAGYFRQALERDPGNKDAQAGLRQVQRLRSTRQVEAARHHQEEARRRLIAQTLAQASQALAAGRPLEARAHYRRVLALDSANRAALSGLVRVRKAMLTLPVGPAVKTAVFRAARAGDEIALKKILDEHPAAARAVDSSGQTPLHVCLRSAHPEAAQRLISAGARIEVRDKFGHTPLHLAAFSGLVSIAAELLARGAAPDPRDKEGDTPLHVAAVQGQVGVAALLLRAGARTSARDQKGDTPLHKAAAADQWPVAALLLSRGADVNARNRRGWTPLHLTAFYGRPLTARLLIERGARLDAVDNYNRTAYAVADRLCRGNKAARDCVGLMDLLTARGLNR